MTAKQIPILHLQQLANAFLKHRWHWAIPTLTLTIVATIYAFTKSDQWEASQALIVRDEVNHSQQTQGRFLGTEDRKHAQETIAELARSEKVVHNALQKMGPPVSYSRPKNWPTRDDVDQARQAIKLVPPGGAEFGTTEVFYLYSSADTQSRTTELITFLLEGIEE
ncbi:MAG: Wzz/FepE/Etk N-terminal domain-containing protein, partial [Pirellulaceae bacterium]|nr:Wzz/FepE/Etk N-terminal domain-containing protein [Pirellulaceae bacterium]